VARGRRTEHRADDEAQSRAPEHRELHRAAAAMPTPEELVARVEMHQRIARMVLKLPEPLRGTLLLRYFEDMSSADMARAQGILGRPGDRGSRTRSIICAPRRCRPQR
jgi:DNA-directed RNA polymerase specialized sigma24 family protein